ncbi:MAG: hypothetical protein QG628_473 [Patescibacteria group bacterium]|nr:hypothetical protein [Patescibacteria group bacterium]
MSESAPNNPITETKIQPHIVYGEANPDVLMDPEAAGITMRELGISDDGISNSTIYIDPKNRLMNNGTHYTNRLGRLRFRSNPEITDATGDVIRLSTRVKSKDRSEELLNRTFVHEAEHLAQGDRHDIKVTEGHLAIYGLAAIGALVGNRLGKGAKGKVGAALGGFMGYQLGYWLAPHERQARQRAGQVRGLAPQVVSKAIHRKS